MVFYPVKPVIQFRELAEQHVFNAAQIRVLLVGIRLYDVFSGPKIGC